MNTVQAASVACSIAVLSLTVPQNAQGQPSIQSPANLLCTIDPETGAGRVTITPPYYVSNSYLFWHVNVHQYDFNGAPLGITSSHFFWGEPTPAVPIGIGGGFTDLVTGQGVVVVPAPLGGYVYIQTSLFDFGTNTWLYQGDFEKHCLVFSQFQ